MDDDRRVDGDDAAGWQQGRAWQRVRRMVHAMRRPDFLTEQLLETRHQGLLIAQQLDRTHEQLLAMRHVVEHELSEVRAALEVLDREVSAVRDEIAEVSEAQRAARASIGRSVAALGEALARLDAPSPAELADGPLVSVVLPVRDRADVVATAVRSALEQTYTNLELLVVDDGCTDGSIAAVREAASGDERVRVIGGPGRGAAAARNAALREAAGDLVTYLDSDNRWLPTYLAHVVSTFRDHPDAGSTAALQIVVDDASRTWELRDDDRPLGDLVHGNFIDLNSFAHRRALVDEVGAFDEALRRLSDWDLIRRYVGARPLLRIPVPGSVYRFGRRDQISETEPVHFYAHLVREKYRVPLVAPGTRVLCAEWHYPQLSESYVQADIEGLKAVGVEVEVWSEEETTAAPYPSEETVHHGDLVDVLDAVRPDVVITHWLNIGERLSSMVARRGIPMVVRGHGFEFDRATLDGLLAEPNVRRVYLFPHLGDEAPVDDRVRALPVCFDATRYRPRETKDPRLVVRCGVALPSKAYETFFEVARLCPDHRFLLCLATAHTLEEHVAEVLDLHESMGSPVEIRIDVPHDEVAELVADAGTYLHTHRGELPFGMPISIAEAMATGAYVIARDLPGCASYVGDAGDLYGDVEQAARLVRATSTWSADTWRVARRRSIDRAYGSFTHVQIGEALVRDWIDLGLVQPAVTGAGSAG